MKADVGIVQSVFDFAIREINALEQRIVHAEDDADEMLWEQARQVVQQLEADLSQRQLAAQWINARTGEPYSQKHVSYTARAFEQFTAQPRPRFRDAYNEIANASKLGVHHSSDSPEHYTPAVIIGAAIKVLGKIDLDPCSNSGEPHVTALNHFTIEDDGLQHRWSGTVYMNPPYGRTIQQWIEKLAAEHQAKHVTAAIALVPARPDTEWWRLLRDHCCCFIAGRLVFGGNEDPAPFPSAVYYLGAQRQRFYKTFSKLGDVWIRVAT